MKRTDITRRLETLAAVAVVRSASSEGLIRVVEALRAGGLRAVEITLTVPEPFALLQAVRDRFGDDVLLGAGSVLEARDAHRAVDAGAQFVVGPTFDPVVMDASHDRGVPYLPGGLTPTELARAHDAGADLVKLFPASAVGPGFLKAVRAPMPFLKLMPTGGVTPENAGAWLRAGAVCVGVGGGLVDASAVAAGNFETLTEAARTLLASVESARA